MTYLFLILFVIFLFIILKELITKQFRTEKFVESDSNGDIVLYDNKPLNQKALKRTTTNSRIKYDCRTTIIECNSDSDCLNLCAENNNTKNKCINGFCAYVYNERENDSLCQNGGTPISYFYRGRFEYAGCLCPPTFIGRFCDVKNKML